MAINVINWQFSEKALQSIKYSDAFINIWEGAVRSSKTVASIVRWLQFVEESDYPEFLMTGKTESTVYRNVIGGQMGIINILGEKRAKFKKSGDGGSRLELKFPNKDPKTKGKHPWITKVCYVVGANDEKSEAKIRGMTIGGWYADEVTLYPESFVKQAINRMSVAGAKAFWTTNPDSPYHYIKTEFIDKAKEKGYRSFHFMLTDNPSLPKSYVDNLSVAYTGLWYKRMVLGLWVMADGIIYDMFKEDTMAIDDVPADVEIIKHWVGVDYGTSNPTTFIHLGMGDDRKLYILDEYYHSGRESGRGKSPKMYAADMRAWLENLRDRYGNRVKPDYIYIDPSAEGFILQLYEEGVRGIAQADNAVTRGIELVASIIGADRLRVLKRCKNTLREFSTYMWDPRKQKIGIDAPLKDNDHTLDSIRYAVNGTRTIWQRILGI